MDSKRNIYKDDVDFQTLALQSPTFAKYLKPNGQLDFSDPEAVQELTKSLLKRDFKIAIELPNDRLCPPVPNRLNYILWVQDLLDTTSDEYTDRYDPERGVVGLDIGTGASCIYPLLGCAQRPKWKFVGTDIDERSLHYARGNVAYNDLKSRIRLMRSAPDGELIPLNGLGLEYVDFTMCNPPFYSSSEELLASAKEKQRPPFSACTGAEIEMVTPGGEVAFVSCIIRESLKLRNRVEWYTTMLGKLASVSVVVTNLKEAGVTNWAVTEFVQGSRTRRWGVAWSWGNMRPKMDLARGISSLPKHLLPFPSEVCFINLDTKIDTLGQCIHSAMQELPIKWRWKPSISTGIGISAGNVWSRASRRRHARGETNGEEIDEDEEALGFKITLKMRKGLEGVDIIARWLLGHDALVFESFCGMLQRKIKESQQAPIETRSDISSSIRG